MHLTRAVPCGNVLNVQDVLGSVEQCHLLQCSLWQSVTLNARFPSPFKITNITSEQNRQKLVYIVFANFKAK